MADLQGALGEGMVLQPIYNEKPQKSVDVDIHPSFFYYFFHQDNFAQFNRHHCQVGGIVEYLRCRFHRRRRSSNVTNNIYLAADTDINVGVASIAAGAEEEFKPQPSTPTDVHVLTEYNIMT